MTMIVTGWSDAELADLRAIAADTTLTWEEVTTALNLRHPERPPRTRTAIRMTLRRIDGFIYRTTDKGTKLGPRAQTRPPAPGAPPELVAFVASLKREARLEVIRAVRATLDSLEALDAP